MENDKPIFVLGTGRCGSTYVQTLISSISDVWIWGEHAGILHGLANWIDNIVKDESLNRFSFPYTGMDQTEIINNNPTAAAWSCPFNPMDVRVLEKNIILSLFNRRMPPGKTRWGFKEIRYGLDGSIPERLLKIFPNSKIVHVIREPFDTVESSLRAWNQPLLRKPPEENQYNGIIDKYNFYVGRWAQSAEYFKKLEEIYPSSVRTVHVENISAEIEQIVEFIGYTLDDIDNISPRGLSLNPADKQLSDEVAFIFDRCRDDNRDKIYELCQTLNINYQ